MHKVVVSSNDISVVSCHFLFCLNVSCDLFFFFFFTFCMSIFIVGSLDYIHKWKKTEVSSYYWL